MTVGIVGRKSGMTRVFTDDGVSVPVTVVEVVPNRVTQIKEQDTDGYRAIQVTAGNRKASKVSKPEAGHFARAGVEAGSGLWEFRLDGSDEAFEVGAELTVERFEQGQKVDVAGQSKGKGFQGGVKRWNFRTQDATHGNSLSHRAQVRSVSARHPVVYSKVRKWRATWALSVSPRKGLKWFASTLSAICCSSKARSRAHPVVT